MPRKARILAKEETTRDRFVRIAEPRVAKVVDGIRGLGNLNRAEYGPPASAHPELVEQLIGAIEGALGELKESFRRKPGSGAAGFRFKDGE